MKKSNWFAMGFILFIIVSFLILVGIARSFTADFIKSELSQKFYQLTGHSLIINGKVHWAFFPQFGIEVEDVVIDNNDKFPEKFLAKANRVYLVIKMIPLFSRQVEIENVVIKEGQMFFYDGSGKKNIELNNLNLKIKNTLSHSFSFDLSGEFKKEPHLVIDNVTLYGTFDVSSEKNIFHFSNLIVHGHLKTALLSIGTFLFKNAQAIVEVKNGMILLHSLTANLYDGNYAGNILIDMNEALPTVALEGTLLKADAGTLIAEMIKKDKQSFTGTADVKTKLKFVAGQKDVIHRTLNGNLNVSIKHGILHGINIPALVERGQAIIKGQALPIIADNQTDFGMLNATFQIRNGMMFNKDLTLQSTQLTATGQGKIDLVNEKVDYRLNAGLVGHKIIIPIVVRGSFDNVVVAPDVKQVLSKVLTEKTDQLLSHIMQGLTQDDPNQKNNLKEKVNEQLKKLHLESLFE